MMHILFLMDPLKKLETAWDNSLYLAGEFIRRGHSVWTADSGDLYSEKSRVFGTCSNLTAEHLELPRKRWRFNTAFAKVWDLTRFNLVVIRKDPPFDSNYFYLATLLESIASRVPIANHPSGIKNTNEKLSILNFPQWIPKTIVTSSPQRLLDFQRKLRRTIVVKPLDQKGGHGVFLLPLSSKNTLSRLIRATQRGTKMLMAQEFLETTRQGEKRIILLGGNILTAYEKKSKPNEFRANLGLGAKWIPTKLSAREIKLTRDLKPYLLKQGLYFVGLDIIDERLIEINVTSPAGITEAKVLYPKRRLVEAWADFLERLSLSRRPLGGFQQQVRS